jgi:hypothetical protein
MPLSHVYALLHPDEVDTESLTKSAAARRKGTFAQLLIEKVLPEGMTVDRPLDKKEVERILGLVFAQHPHMYGRVVSDLKKLGDSFSTYEGISFGMDELSVPHKVERDKIFKKYHILVEGSKNDAEKVEHLDMAQNEIAALDLRGAKDDASLMITSGGMGGKKAQQMKLRSGPIVFKNHLNELVPELVNKSYAEGLSLKDYWNGAAEARHNLMTGQVSTALPGSASKTLNSLLSTYVISTVDCGTRHGISLNTKDEDVLDRYLAATVGKYSRNTLVTSDVQQQLMRSKVEKILVRSPQTCEAIDNTLCQKCWGLSVSHRKAPVIGTALGSQTSGALGESAVQLVLGAKHSTTLARKPVDLEGIKGLNIVTGMPKVYPNQRVIAELFGKVVRIILAPQGGTNIWIRISRKVPDKFIVDAIPVEGHALTYMYYVPPARKILEDIKVDTEIVPGQALTDGNINLKSIARLSGLGGARTQATNMIRDVFQSTGASFDRRHFELLSRAQFNYVKLVKVPPGFPFKRGEVIDYNKLRGAASRINGQTMLVDNALGYVLAEELNGVTVGTELTPSIIQQLKQGKVKKVRVTMELEISPIAAPLERVTMMGDQPLHKLNYRYLGDAIQQAATTGQKQDVRGYSPISAYAVGDEFNDYGSESRGKPGKKPGSY